MFVKIVDRDKKGSHRIQCRGVRDTINERGDLQLYLDGSAIDSYIIGKDRKGRIDVYFLNEEGKTFDSINWR